MMWQARNYNFIIASRRQLLWIPEILSVTCILTKYYNYNIFAWKYLVRFLVSYLLIKYLLKGFGSLLTNQNCFREHKSIVSQTETAESKKMNKVLFILFHFVQLVVGETDRILDKLEKCLPNEKFTYVNYVSSPKASDATFYQQFSSLENNPSVLVGIHDR